jgi:hypothetical protein
MAGRKIVLELPEELFAELEGVADALGIGTPAEAALMGVAEWVSRQKSEIGNRDPGQRYFINEALDELEKKK